MLGIEPRAAGWEARMPPLCWAAPKLTVSLLQESSPSLPEQLGQPLPDPVLLRQNSEQKKQGESIFRFFIFSPKMIFFWRLFFLQLTDAKIFLSLADSEPHSSSYQMLLFQDALSKPKVKWVIDDLAQSRLQLGSGCGSVGWVFTSDTRYLRFKSQHQQNAIYQL